MEREVEVVGVIGDMSLSRAERLLLSYVRARPGHYRIRRWPPVWVMRAVWRLWRRGAIRIDWRLRLWPVEQP